MDAFLCSKGPLHSVFMALFPKDIGRKTALFAFLLEFETWNKFGSLITSSRGVLPVLCGFCWTGNSCAGSSSSTSGGERSTCSVICCASSCSFYTVLHVTRLEAWRFKALWPRPQCCSAHFQNTWVLTNGSQYWPAAQLQYHFLQSKWREKDPWSSSFSVFFSSLAESLCGAVCLQGAASLSSICRHSEWPHFRSCLVLFSSSMFFFCRVCQIWTWRLPKQVLPSNRVFFITLAKVTVGNQHSFPKGPSVLNCH